MYYLAISKENGAIYTGINRHQLHLAHPFPMLLPLKFELAEFDPFEHTGFPEAPRRIFLEDHFDPVTRVRRGRVYLLEDSQPGRPQVIDPYKQGKFRCIDAFIYQRQPLNSGNAFKGPTYPTVLLGGEAFRSTWKIISIEEDSSRTFVLLLKSYRSLGEIPELKRSEISEEIQKQLDERLEHVENSVNRETPINVVDRCRDAASLILSCITKCPGDDLGKALKKYSSHPAGNEKKIVQNLADSIRLLHARGKPNEEHNRGTAPLTEEDGQLAVRALGLILREVGWAT